MNRKLSRALLLASSVGLLLVSGCRVVEETGKLPMYAVGLVVPLSKSPQPNPALLQTDLQRFSDDYLNRTVAALDDYARSIGTPEAAKQALAWKISLGSSIVSIVSGPNPTANLIDVLALATISRTSVEEYWSKTPSGPAFQSFLQASRVLETNAWRLADGIVTPLQEKELRETIGQWWQLNSNVRNGFFARPQEFTSLLRQSSEKKAQPGSVFALVGLDPTAGLDPAVREVTRTRLFAERAMYTAQRMPFLVRWQVELLTGELLSGPLVATALTNATRLVESADRLSHASESVSQTAAQLPDRLVAERKVILETLETQEGRLRELSSDISRTLAAGEKMSTSLNTTLTTLEAVMKRFGVGETASKAPNTNLPPFNILDYAHTADQMALLAKELDVLLKDAGNTMDSPALRQRIEDFSAIAERTKADAKSVLNHAFLLGACLVCLTFACALAYRRLGRSSMRRSEKVLPPALDTNIG